MAALAARGSIRWFGFGRYTPGVRLELHCHSTCSDGSLDPEQLAQALADSRPELACLTDHDTMAGSERFAAALACQQPEGAPTRVLRGLELSCKHAKRTVHLLIWGVPEGPARARFEARLAAQLRRRRERIVAICERLAGLGIELDPAPILDGARDRTPGRPDVARALVAAGHCSDFRAAFTKYLRDDGPANVEMDNFSIAEALELANELGARVGLAHPHTLKHFAIVRALFVEFRDAGLGAIEAFYGTGSPTQAEPWLRLARELDLVVTAGSDFHGGGAVAQITRPGIELPEPHASRLRDYFAELPSIDSDASASSSLST